MPLHKTAQETPISALLIPGRVDEELEDLADRLVDELGDHDAQRLADRLSALSWEIDGSISAAPTLAHDDRVVEERTEGRTTFRLELRTCGKGNCKCARGELHGPYWYAYQRKKGKLTSRYVGKNLD